MLEVPYVVLIPARWGSSRLPQKPLLDLAGLPMVVRVARQAMATSAQQVLVAADHPDIVKACQAHGVQALLTRQDHASGSDRLAEAAEQLGLSDEQIVVNVQGDEPLIDPQHIHDLAQTLPKHPDCVMATLAHPITTLEEWRSPHVVKVVLDASSKASYFSRASIPHWRDAAPEAIPPQNAYRHVGLYAYRAGFLKQFPKLPSAPTEELEALEQLRVLWHGYAMAVHVSSHASAPGVDTEADLARVRALLLQTSAQ